MSAAHKDDQVLDLDSEKYSVYHSAILLASASIVAFAGAAAAEISFSGSAVLGYNDTEITPDAANDDDFGFYSELNLDVAFSAELDNGVTLSAQAGIDELDAVEGGFASGVTLTIATDTAALIYGDTTFALEDHYAAVGSMDADANVGEQDGELVVKATVNYGSVEAGVSYEINDATSASVTGATNDEVGGMSFGATADLGSVTAAVVFQAEETAAGLTAQDEIMGVRVATAVAGADVAFGYVDNRTADL